MRNHETANRTLREWLGTERLLGITHVASAAEATDTQPFPSAEARPDPEPPRERARQAQLLTAQGPQHDHPGLPALCDRELPVDEARQQLAALDAEFVKDCTRCGLCTGRKQTVFGVGLSRPEIVFVGEGPGADEDAQGVPFVGRAGQLLSRMIAAMTLTRDQVYICNIVKCRPPGNRTPTEEEMRACLPFLLRQLAMLRPKVIVALGRPATQCLLDTRTPIGRLRGQFHDFPPPSLASSGVHPAQLMPTYHPAYLLRSPEEKKKSWDDLQQVMRFLGLSIPG